MYSVSVSLSLPLPLLFLALYFLTCAYLCVCLCQLDASRNQIKKIVNLIILSLPVFHSEVPIVSGNSVAVRVGFLPTGCQKAREKINRYILGIVEIKIPTVLN